MRFSRAEKAQLVAELAAEPNKVQRLRELGIPASTYYAWKLRVAERGPAAFIAESSAPKRIWNRLSQAERELIESEARKHTELSCRLLAPASSTDLHKPMLPSHKLDEILSLRVERTVHQDFIVRYKNQYFQPLRDQLVRVRPKEKLFVEIRLDGTMHLRLKGCSLKFKTIEKPSRKPQDEFKPELWVERPVKRHVPSADHPWKKNPWKRPAFIAPLGVGSAAA